MANNKPTQAQSPLEEALQMTATEAFIQKYKKQLIGGVSALILIVLCVSSYKTFYSEPRENKASTELATGQTLFMMGDYETALKGDSANYSGFVAIASNYSGTDAANLASLYAGLCNAQLGNWEEAVKYLEDFDAADDQMISPAAVGALGNAYANTKQLDKAVSTLKKAAKMADNNALAPTFLVQAGEILESQGNKAEALELYEEVKAKYINSMAYQTIDKYIERCKAGL